MPRDKHRTSSKVELAPIVVGQEESTKRVKKLKKEDVPLLLLQQRDIAESHPAALLDSRVTAEIRAEKKNKANKHTHSHDAPSEVESATIVQLSKGEKESNRKLKRPKGEDATAQQQPLLPPPPPLPPTKPQSNSQAPATAAPTSLAPPPEPVSKKDKQKQQQAVVGEEARSGRHDAIHSSGQGKLAVESGHSSGSMKASAEITQAAASHLKRKHRNEESTGNSTAAAACPNLRSFSFSAYFILINSFAASLPSTNANSASICI